MKGFENVRRGARSLDVSSREIDKVRGLEETFEVIGNGIDGFTKCVEGICKSGGDDSDEG